MSEAIHIRNVRIIDPADGSDRIGDLSLKDGVIVSSNGNSSSEKMVDGSGLVAAPGFFDLHTHLREPGFEDKETIETGAAAGACGGFTTLCAMPNTSPTIDSASVVDFIYQQARLAGPIRVLAFGAVSRGREGKELTDMEELCRAGVVGFTDDGSPVATGHLMQSALLYAAQLGLPIMDHCEDHGIVKGLGVNEGWVSSRLGLEGYPAAAEESIIARDIALAELTGGHFHVAHLSTAGGIEQVRLAKSRGLRVTAEVTPHHLSLTEDWVLGTHGHLHQSSVVTAVAYDTRAKVSPPLRSAADRDALVAALADGTIDAIATDHAPHTFGDKAVTFDDATVGISVLETAFGSLMGLVHSGALDLPTLLQRMTTGPASILGKRFEEFGTLREGTAADIVLFDPDEVWMVDAQTFVSKGKNTPLDGDMLKGRVKMTIARGEIAFDELGA